MRFRKGDKIEVIDQNIVPWPIRGTILEIDDHPIGSSFAKILVDSAALPAPEVWVNLRLAGQAERGQ